MGVGQTGSAFVKDKTGRRFSGGNRFREEYFKYHFE